MGKKNTLDDLLGGQNTPAADINIAGRGVKHTGSTLNIKVEDIETARMMFIAVIVDDSGSISMAGNTSLVVDGFNEMFVDGLRGSKAEEGIYLVVETLNRGRLFEGYITENPRLTARNYIPSGGTPLFDRSRGVLDDCDAKVNEFEDNGVEANVFCFIISDGGDTASNQWKPKDVQKKVQDMGEKLMILALGMDDKGTSTGGASTDFKKVFADMGIPANSILVAEWDPTSDPSKEEFRSRIRRAFAVASKSAARASQSGDSFAKASAAGFTD